MADPALAYTVRIHRENGGLRATVDEHPGAFATGNDLAELGESLAEAITLVEAPEPPAEITPEEGRRIFDEVARRKLRISGEEFICCWDAGEYAGPVENPRAQEVGMMIPMVRTVDAKVDEGDLPVSEPFRWAESIGSSGIGEDRIIEIDVAVPGRTAWEPMTLTVQQARELHDMLGDAIADEHPGRSEEPQRHLQAVATPEPGQPTDEDDDTVIVVTEGEFREDARRALAELGLTYAELAECARKRDFPSPQAHSLWVCIGGTVGL